MPRLQIDIVVTESPVDAGDGTDRTLDDPEDVANEIVETYNEWAQAQGYDGVHLIEARWVT